MSWKLQGIDGAPPVADHVVHRPKDNLANPQGHAMGDHVRVEQQRPVPLAVVKRCVRQSDLPRVVPECCGIVWNALKAAGVTGAGRHVAVYLDAAINLEVGVELPAPFGGVGEVVPSSLPAGQVATATHLGPYGGLPRTHDAVLQWCRSNGRSLAGPSWEIYGHWQHEWTHDPSKIRTDVYYLLSSPSA